LKTIIKSAKFETFKLSVFFLALACERIFIKTHSIESRKCYRTGRYTVYRRVHATFSPEIVQAGAVKGLNSIRAWIYRQLVKGSEEG